MTLVPPDMSTFMVCSKGTVANCMAWSTRLMLPAVPMSMVMSYFLLVPGVMVSSLEPSVFPSTLEPVISTTACTAVQCCLERPLVGLFSLILVRWTSLPVTVLIATDVRTLCPPPSPLEQSISSMDTDAP